MKLHQPVSSAVLPLVERLDVGFFVEHEILRHRHRFYNNLIALQAQKRTSGAPEVSGDPDFKLVFTKVDGTSLTTEFYLADESIVNLGGDKL